MFSRSPHSLPAGCHVNKTRGKNNHTEYQWTKLGRRHESPAKCPMLPHIWATRKCLLPLLEWDSHLSSEVSVLMTGRAEAGITRPRELSLWDITCILCLPRRRTHLAENTAEGFSGFLARSPKERLHFLYKRQGLPSLGDLKKSGELCQQAQTPGDRQQETRCPQGGCTSLKPQLGTTLHTDRKTLLSELFSLRN